LENNSNFAGFLTIFLSFSLTNLAFLRKKASFSKAGRVTFFLAALSGAMLSE